MQYRRVGNSGLRVSALSLGGWLTFGERLDTAGTRAILGRAVERGVNFIDLADVYNKGNTERAVGACLPDFRRADLVLSSKVFWPMSQNINDRGLSRKHILESVDESLQRLRTDYLDIYFCHREDPESSLDETVRAMDDLVRRGKILYWGTSVWSAGTLRRAHRIARAARGVGPIVEQPLYNLLDRSIEGRIVPATRRLGMGLVVWSPLAGGLLSGKYTSGVPEGSRAGTTSWLRPEQIAAAAPKVRALAEIAGGLGCTPAQLALAWLLHQPFVSSVITGATSIDQLEQNLSAAEIALDAGTLARIARAFPRARPTVRDAFKAGRSLLPGRLASALGARAQD